LWQGITFIKEDAMPEKETLERAEQDKREGKSPSTQAGEFVREEIHHIREGKHGAASAKHRAFQDTPGGSGPGAAEERHRLRKNAQGSSPRQQPRPQQEEETHVDVAVHEAARLL